MKKHEGDPPACKDCAHLCDNFCYNDDCSAFDRVDGRIPVTAATARKDGKCGLSGAFFEPKPMPSRFVVWADQNFGWAIIILGVAAAAITYWVDHP